MLRPVDLTIEASLRIEQHIEAMDVDLRQMRRPCKGGVAGFLGLNFLAQFQRVTLDMRKHYLTLSRRR